MKASEIRKMTTEQRFELLEKLRRELIILKSKAKRGTLKQTAKIRQIRKDLARLLTVMREYGEI